MKLRTIGVFLILLILWWFMWPWPFASARGRIAAYEEMKAGNYTLVVYGLPSPCGQEYYRLMSQRYGIRIHRVAQCIMPESLCAYSDEYDQLSMAAVVQKNGHDVFKEAYDEAKRNWEIKSADRTLSQQIEEKSGRHFLRL